MKATMANRAEEAGAYYEKERFLGNKLFQLDAGRKMFVDFPQLLEINEPLAVSVVP